MSRSRNFSGSGRDGYSASRSVEIVVLIAPLESSHLAGGIEMSRRQQIFKHNKRFSPVSVRTRRSLLRHECLEPRMLLSASPWTNPLNPLDATGDNKVTSRDALVMINLLGQEQSNELAEWMAPPILDPASTLHPDANGDGKISSLDPLYVINSLGQEKPDGATSVLLDQPGEVGQAAHALVMANDYGHAMGKIEGEDDKDAFRFVATRSRASINAISGDQQRGVRVQVLDRDLTEVASSESDPQRQPFEGQVITVQPGREYFVIVERMANNPAGAYSTLASEAIDTGPYALAVYQYDTHHWPLDGQVSITPEDDSVEDQSPLNDQIGTDAEGDRIQDATPIDASDGTHTSVRSINHAGDVDMFQFHTPAEGPTYAMIAVGGFGEFMDVDFSVLDSAGQVVDTESSSWVSEVDWVVAFDVQADQDYFLKVTASADKDAVKFAATGQYSLTVKFAEGSARSLAMIRQPYSDTADSPLGADVHGATFEDATRLILGEGVTSLVDIDPSAAERSSGIDYFGDEDMFKIPVSGDVMLVVVEGDDVSLEVYDEQRQIVVPESQLFSWDVLIGGSFNVSGSDHFFVRVYGDGESIRAYFLQAQAAGPNSIGAPEQPVTEPFGSSEPITGPTGPGEPINTEDLHGDTFAEATDVAAGNDYVVIPGTLQTDDDVDIFRIPNVLPGTLGVFGLHEVKLDVFDQQGNLVPTRSGGNSPGLDFGYRDAVDGDFVFLQVSSDSGATGRYNLSFLLSGTAKDDLPGFNPSFDIAASFSQPDSAIGDDPHPAGLQSSRRLIADESSNILVSSFIDVSGDVDVFRMRPSSASETVFTLESNLEDPSVRLFDRYGNELIPDRTDVQPGVLEIRFDEMVVPRQPGRSYGDISIWISAGAGDFGQYTLRSEVILKGPEADSWKFAPDPTDDVRTALLPPFGGWSADFGGATQGIDQHGDSADSATPIDIALPEYQVSSYIDAPGDKDAFRFTAEYPDAIFALYDQFGDRQKGQVLVLDADGNELGEVVERDGEPQKGTRANLTVGDEYTVVVGAATPNTVGGYHLKIQPLGNVASLFRGDNAIDLVIEDHQAIVSGRITRAGQVDLYRLTSHDVKLASSAEGPEGLRFQFIHAGHDGQVLSRLYPWTPEFQVLLPSAVDNEDHDVYLVVWNPDNNHGDYELNLRLYDRETLATQADRFLDIPMTRLAGNTDVEITRFRATEPYVALFMRASSPVDYSIDSVLVRVFDEDGNELPEVDAVDPLPPFFTRHIQVRLFKITEGSEYIVRAENPTGNLLAVSMAPRQLDQEAAETMIVDRVED